jgi:carbamoylphosphate synthase small subunit
VKLGHWLDDTTIPAFNQADRYLTKTLKQPGIMRTQLAQQ